MLQAVVIREHTAKILEGLRKRNLKDADVLIQAILDNDLLRRDTQRILDDLKAKSNLDSKKIGELMKSGQATEATALRAAVAARFSQYWPMWVDSRLSFRLRCAWRCRSNQASKAH